MVRSGLFPWSRCWRLSVFLIPGMIVAPLLGGFIWAETESFAAIVIPAMLGSFISLILIFKVPEPRNHPRHILESGEAS